MARAIPGGVFPPAAPPVIRRTPAGRPAKKRRVLTANNEVFPVSTGGIVEYEEEVSMCVCYPIFLPL
jgi:hypothetical protein